MPPFPESPSPATVPFPGPNRNRWDRPDNAESLLKPRKLRSARVELSPDQQSLVERYQPLAKRIANSYLRLRFNASDNDDIFAAAYLGLSEAAANFDPTDKTDFSLFARKRIKGSVLDFLAKLPPTRLEAAAILDAGLHFEVPRSICQHPHERTHKYEYGVRFDEPRSVQPRSTLTHNRECDPSEPLDRLLNFERLVKALSPKHKEVLRSRYFDDLTQEETARTLKMSQSEVSRIERLSIDHLRQALSA